MSYNNIFSRVHNDLDPNTKPGTIHTHYDLTTYRNPESFADNNNITATNTANDNNNNGGISSIGGNGLLLGCFAALLGLIFCCASVLILKIFNTSRNADYPGNIVISPAEDSTGIRKRHKEIDEMIITKRQILAIERIRMTEEGEASPETKPLSDTKPLSETKPLSDTKPLSETEVETSTETEAKTKTSETVKTETVATDTETIETPVTNTSRSKFNKVLFYLAMPKYEIDDADNEVECCSVSANSSVITPLTDDEETKDLVEGTNNMIITDSDSSINDIEVADTTTTTLVPKNNESNNTSSDGDRLNSKSTKRTKKKKKILRRNRSKESEASKSDSEKTSSTIGSNHFQKALARKDFLSYDYIFEQEVNFDPSDSSSEERGATQKDGWDDNQDHDEESAIASMNEKMQQQQQQQHKGLGKKHGIVEHYMTEETKCSMCLKQYQVGDEICFANNPECTHVFHTSCIVHWLTRSPHCPCCKVDYLHIDGEGTNNRDEEVCLTIL